MTLTNKILTFKIASTPTEFDAIHELNYQTFVEEIPQHSKNKEKILVDKYHEQNTYIICLQEDILLGMLAIRDVRPFSLDHKIKNLDTYLPDASFPFEIRLLAIKDKFRNTTVFKGLLEKSFNLALNRGYDLGLVSGTTRQIKLYKHIGFKPFGELVGHGDALYQPMYLTLNKALGFKQKSRIFKKKHEVSTKRNLPNNYLPGPVTVAETVLQAHAAIPISHRSSQFESDFSYLQKELEKLVNTDKAYVLNGSGTLANDVVAAQLSCLNGQGLVLINGEFGSRLENHAFRAGLNYDTLYASLGSTFNEHDIKKKLASMPTCSWIWLVHCETSTGVLNDISFIAKLCQQKSIHLCLDCISTIGCYPLDLQHVYLATGTSGKGLASIPSLALVFANKKVPTKQEKLPKYFDLSNYDNNNGIAFTISSNAVYALSTALETDWKKRHERLKAWSANACDKLESMGLNIQSQPYCRAYHVITIVLPERISSKKLGHTMQKSGYLISYKSEYLLKNNSVQFCFMGHTSALDNNFYEQLDACIQEK